MLQLIKEFVIPNLAQLGEESCISLFTIHGHQSKDDFFSINKVLVKT